MNRYKLWAATMLFAASALSPVPGFATAESAAKESKKASENTGAPAEQGQIDQNMVVGKINNQTIRFFDVVERLQSMPPQLTKNKSIEALFPLALQQMVTRIALSKKARDAGVDKTAEFKKARQEAEIDIMNNLYMMKDLKQTYSEDELKKEYDAYVKSFVIEDQVSAKHILVAEEKQAEEIISKLKSGEDFSKLVHMTLDKGTLPTGGDLGFFGKSDLDPTFTEAVFKLENGKFTEKPVKTNFGYHVILREKSRKSEPLPFEKAKAQMLPMRLQQKAIHDRLVEAIKGSKIELHNLDGSPINPEEFLDPTKQFKALTEGAKAPAKADDKTEKSKEDKKEEKSEDAKSEPKADEDVAKEAGKKAGKAAKK